MATFGRGIGEVKKRSEWGMSWEFVKRQGRAEQVGQGLVKDPD